MKVSSLCAVVGLIMCVSQLAGCGSADNSDQIQRQIASDKSSPKTSPPRNESASNESSRDVPPGMAGSFDFVCPEEGQATIAISGDCDKSITLISLEWASAAEKVNAAPGLRDALARKDDAAIKRIIDEQFGGGPVAKTYFTDADVNVKFDAPVGRIVRTFHLLKGKHMLAVSNRSNRVTKIETTFVPAP